MRTIAQILAAHENLRRSGINLIASENAMPPAAAAVLSTDLQARYHSAWYGGTKFIREMIARTEELAEGLFRAKHAIVTALSGNLCDLAAVMALTEPGDSIAALPFSAGGYPMDFGRFGRRRVDIAVAADGFEPDPARTALHGPVKMLMAGASYIPFPHPVRELTRLCGRVVYDGSHVMGLIACGVFQDPLREGAMALIGSTHKSLPGPQGGLVLTDSDDVDAAFRSLLDLDLDRGIALVDNPHPARIAALGMAIEHLIADPAYGGRVVANARALATALRDRGVPVKFAGRGFTESHQVFLDLGREESGAYCAVLENHGIFIDVAGRMGTSEVTSRGMDQDDMLAIADRMSDLYRENLP